MGRSCAYLTDRVMFIHQWNFKKIAEIIHGKSVKQSQKCVTWDVNETSLVWLYIYNMKKITEIVTSSCELNENLIQSKQTIGCTGYLYFYKAHTDLI